MRMSFRGFLFYYGVAFSVLSHISFIACDFLCVSSLFSFCCVFELFCWALFFVLLFLHGRLTICALNTF